MAEENKTESIETFIGIDVGTAAIKIAEACRAGKDGVAFMKVAAEQIVGLENATDEAVAKIIRDLAAENGFTSRRAVFVLNGSFVTVKHSDFPKMPADALEKTVRFELKKDINYSIDDCVFGFRQLKEFDSKADDGSSQKKVRVIVAAVEQRVISRFTAIAKIAGYEVAGFASASLSLYSISKKMKVMENMGPEEVLMFLDFGNSQMTASFVTGSGLKFSKDINMGGSALTTVIKTMFPGDSPLTLMEAEEQKFKIGLLSQDEIDNLDDSYPRANLHKVLNVSFKKLFQRIRLSTGYYFAHFQDSSISSQTMKKICVFGGNGEIPGVLGYFSDSYDALVVKADSWEAVERSNASAAICEKYNASFFNLAASFHEFFYPEYAITFVQEKKTVEKPGATAGIDTAIDNFFDAKVPGFQKFSKFGFVNSVLTLAAVYFIFFTFVFISNYKNIYDLSREKSELQDRISVLSSPEAAAARKKINEKYEAFQKKLGARQVIEFRKFGLDEVLKSIADILPEGVNLKSVTFANEDSPVLGFAGRSPVYDRVIKLNDALKKMKAFSSVSVKRTEQSGDNIDFQFECSLARGEGGEK